MHPTGDLILLRRQVVQLRIMVVAMAAVMLVGAATVRHGGEVRAQRLVIEDGAGRDRIVLEADGRDARPSIEVRGADGARRVSLGEAPAALIDGKPVPRVAPAWGLMIHDPAGDERGGFNYLDNGRSVISIDRAHGEGVYMTVNEKSGFAGLVANYDTGKAGYYAEALRIGTLGRQAFAQVANRDGSPAGALVAGERGRATTTDVVQR